MLDKYQENATKCINNHSIIIAGAGTGKTTTLINKINYLIENNIKPEEILVLSFTNESVNDFKSKCKHNIEVLTFHKIALKYIDNYEITDDELLDNIIENFLNNTTKKLKKKIYKLFKTRLAKFTENNYKKIIYQNEYNSIKKYIKSIILSCKANNINISKINISNFSKNEIIILYISQKIYSMYIQELKFNDLIDFDDIIIKATNNIKNNIIKVKYKHILIDEYQDISQIRFELIESMEKSSNAILTVVGDDFQSIYEFAGSNIKLFYNFKKTFSNVKEFKLLNTYRCPQKIVNIAGNFIMKNSLQIKKNLESVNKVSNCYFKIRTYNEEEKIYKIIMDNCNKKIFLLSRNNHDINKICKKHIKYVNSTIYIDNKPYNNVKFMTVHKSKGLEAEIVIIFNLTNYDDGIPCKKNNAIINKLICYENYPYAEERRLFYVAMTRAKEKLFIIVNMNNPSIFTKEI